MPRGVYKHNPHTEEWKKANSERMKGKRHTLGLKHSESTKQKISEAHRGDKHPMFGKHHSKEAIQKMSLAKKGKLPEQFNGYWIGREQTPEHRAKSVQSLSINPHRYKKGDVAPMKGRKAYASGDKHHNWRGGLSKYRSVYNERRKILLANAEGSHTIAEWELLKTQYGYRCPMCLKHEPEIKLTKDHIIPLSKGGSNYIENIQPLCQRCNSKKYNKLIDRIQIVDKS